MAKRACFRFHQADRDVCMCKLTPQFFGNLAVLKFGRELFYFGEGCQSFVDYALVKVVPYLTLIIANVRGIVTI